MDRFSSLNINLRLVGAIMIVISIILFFIIYTITQTIMGLRLELHESCPLPAEACPYKSSVPVEPVAAFVLDAAIGIFGVVLIFFKPSEIVSFRKTKAGKAAKSLDGEEKKIYDLILEQEGSAFQNDLIQKTGYSKVKISRILDRLETKDLVERRRRGMSNLVVLKY